MGFFRRITGGAQTDAANTQAAAGREAIASNERALETARGDLQRFREAGGAILPALQQLVQEGPETDFERTEGFRAIQNSAAAGGKLQSGGALKELTRFNSGLNARNRNQRFNELFNLGTLGANAASGQATATLGTARSNADTLVGIGDVQAAGQIGRTNTQQGILSGFLSLLGEK